MPGFFIPEALQVAGEISEMPPNTVETHRQHRWRITKLGSVDINAIAGETLVAHSVQLPNVEIEQQEIKGALVTYKFAKGIRWEDVTLTVYDTFGLLEAVHGWRNSIYSNTLGIKPHGGPPGAVNSGYKQDTIVEQLDGAGDAIELFTLKGSWPRRISHGPLSYGSSDIKLLTLTIAYDFAEVESFFG